MLLVPPKKDFISVPYEPKNADDMKQLNFEAKYVSDNPYRNEIDVLGENMNELSESLETAIKDLKNANIALKQDIAKKEEIDEMRNEFLSNVSHELKTPIALIQGYAEGLKEGINDDEENIQATADFITEDLGNRIQCLQLLNYMRLGEEKYRSLNRKYPMEGFELDQDLANKRVSEIASFFRSRGIECGRGKGK